MGKTGREEVRLEWGRGGGAAEFTGDSLEMPVPASMPADAGEMQENSASPTAGKPHLMGFHGRRG